MRNIIKMVHKGREMAVLKGMIPLTHYGMEFGGQYPPIPCTITVEPGEEIEYRSLNGCMQIVSAPRGQWTGGNEIYDNFEVEEALSVLTTRKE